MCLPNDILECIIELKESYIWRKNINFSINSKYLYSETNYNIAFELSTEWNWICAVQIGLSDGNFGLLAAT